MAKRPMDNGKIDETAYRDAEAHFQIVSQVLPPDALRDLAREVVRRLAFRMPQQVDATQLPSREEIDLLCRALLSTEEHAADRLIFAARREGVAVERIYLAYVAEAARAIGRMWERDEISFVDVTLASGRLYRIIRGLRHVLDPAFRDERRDRHVLFVLVPDETHTLGIEIASDVFRRRGWDVEMSIGDDHDTVVKRSEQSRFAAIVLVANSERRLAGLISLVLSLRITQPLAHVVVAGNIVDQQPEIARVVGADAVLNDIETASARLADVISDT